MRTAWLGSCLLLTSCALPDRWHAFGAYGFEGDSALGGKQITNDDSYSIGAGISGELFPSVHRKTDRRPPDPLQGAPAVDEVVVEPSVPDPRQRWWQDANFLQWVERFGLAVLFIIVGRHGEEVVKKTKDRVKKMREKTSPSP